jgi:hypothetical protein
MADKSVENRRDGGRASQHHGSTEMPDRALPPQCHITEGRRCELSPRDEVDSRHRRLTAGETTFPSYSRTSQMGKWMGPESRGVNSAVSCSIGYRGRGLLRFRSCCLSGYQWVKCHVNVVHFFHFQHVSTMLAINQFESRNGNSIPFAVSVSTQPKDHPVVEFLVKQRFACLACQELAIRESKTEGRPQAYGQREDLSVDSKCAVLTIG